MDVCVVMFYMGVLCFLTKCAVNGDIFIVEFGITFISWMISAILSANVIFDHLVSLFNTDRRRFIVCIRRSIMPTALWSPAGASISFILWLLQKISNCLDLNAWAWSHLIFLGIPSNFIYFSRYSIAVSVCGYRKNLSTDASIYESFCCSSVIGPAKSNWISSFGF